jgi:hypothetical protein
MVGAWLGGQEKREVAIPSREPFGLGEVGHRPYSFFFFFSLHVDVPLDHDTQPSTSFSCLLSSPNLFIPSPTELGSLLPPPRRQPAKAVRQPINDICLREYSAGLRAAHLSRLDREWTYGRHLGLDADAGVPLNKRTAKRG